MFDPWHFVLFLSAAGVLALMPGPGIFYVAARTLAGGRGEGLASSFGTGLGGFVHIIAGAIGVSAIVMASAEAFTVLKFVGALYLVYLGIKTWREAGGAPELGNGMAIGARRRDIIGQFLVEAMTLTGAGGVLGIVIAVLLTLLIGALAPALPSKVPSWALITGFSVSVAVGLFFGVWPAVKASRLDPVEALRYE